MSSAFGWFLLLVLASRVLLIARDAPLSPRQGALLALVQTAALDRREYNAGRFIGVLERLLVYMVVLQGQYMAIGLILAAKGFARFKELDEREFAEYVLIGTLLSVTSAVAVGELVKLLLP